MNYDGIWRFLTVFGIAVCHTMCSRSVPTSQTLHTEGRVFDYRNFDIKALKCQQNEVAEIDQPMVSYVREHIKHIIHASQSILPQGLSAEMFCVEPAVNLMQALGGGNAGIDGTGKVFIMYPFHILIENDAQMAFAMSHELAHFLMGHGHYPAASDGRLNENAEYQGILAQLRQLSGAEKANDLEDQEKIKILATQKLALELAVFGTEKGQNWTEQVADEIGYELYLRAGFPKDEPGRWFEVIEKKLGDLLKDNSIVNLPGAEPEPQDLVKKDQRCVRGHEDHPSSCWRRKNLEDEYSAHKIFYDHVMSDALRPPDFSQGLDQVKKQYKDTCIRLAGEGLFMVEKCIKN